jgi:hypothetical protein
LFNSSLDLQNAQINWKQKEARLENKIKDFEKEKIEGYESVTLLNKRLRESEKKYGDLLVKWHDKEKKLQKNIDKQEAELQELKIQLFFHSLSSASQEVFRSVLPSNASSWINSRIQTSSFYNLPSPGYIFAWLILLNIGTWECFKRFLRKLFSRKKV